MIERTEQEGIVTLRLAHGKASLLDIELVEAIARAIAEYNADDGARVLVLTGTGSIFSAGVDLVRLVDGGTAYVDRLFPALAHMLLDLFSIPKPLIVATNGHAIAGGCIMTLAGDYRLMAAGNGRIGIPELLVGVPFPPTILEAIRFALPPQHLQMLVYTGRTVLPDEALRLGMVDEVVDAAQFETRTMELARHFAGLPQHAFLLAKRQVRDKIISRAKHYAAELEGDALELWRDPATHQVIRDYLAKTVRK
ncbi:MAG TPA: enoyl-CoA hydratase/isomerase family protein [Thermoanaerobaculia bacterium]|nr:enoyl-CoA hydratase/isomerase family protein [Thermoanaerobaculia bacterium]